MKAIIPVAGSGTRMYPLGLTTPKCLLPVLNKPILVWTLEHLAANQVTEALLIVNTGEFGHRISSFVQSLHLPNLTIKTLIQPETLGTAHAVQMAKDSFGPNEEFIFLYGDDLYGPTNIKTIVQHQGLAVMGQAVADPEKWGIFQADSQHNLIKVVEKPSEAIGNLANIGCMKLDSRVFDIFNQLAPSTRNEYELTDTLQILTQQTPIAVLPTEDYWIPVGYPWHLLAATEKLAPQITANIEGTVEEHVTIKGKVILPKSSTIMAGTYIEGNVVVGENVKIGPNARLRDNVSIGNNSIVGFSVEIKNSVIGHDTFVPHLSYVGDSLLGNDVNFAGGSITANIRHDHANVKTPVKGQMVDTGRLKLGAIIGDHARLGIGTKIYPGRKIWPNQSTLPGQVVDKDIIE